MIVMMTNSIGIPTTDYYNEITCVQDTVSVDPLFHFRYQPVLIINQDPESALGIPESETHFGMTESFLCYTWTKPTNQIRIIR